MPDKTSVSVVFRIRRPGGEDERMTGLGELHRLHTGWALKCRIASASAESDLTLVARSSEIRMNRKGMVAQEQLFLVGEWRSGSLGTPYGTLSTEAWTHRVKLDLSPSGGSVEWEYDMKIMGETFERCSIQLDIREEQTS